MFFSLQSMLFGISIATSDSFWLVFAWYIYFFYSFSPKLSVSCVLDVSLLSIIRCGYFGFFIIIVIVALFVF